ncbi:DUF624 domain-containing protein [Radiobacillus kanasensis]|uniref:YesL family protein n=1 Tax=Radiobacillus kanasensis TaxID=2844358 RepID=UPI001E5EC143|nr:DUF624 domain-containing protein [Radiobacillus kanasensis]UFT99226.1 DUF624 domain-containing protein [Radiobacillus kanasensis]
MGGLLQGINSVSEWIMRFSVTNLLWLLFNLPIVFLVMNLVFADQLADAYILIGLLIVLAPFVLVPSTAAMFALVREWMMKDDSISLWKSFLQFYKKEYGKMWKAGIPITVLWGIWAADVYYLHEKNTVFFFATLLLGVVLYVWTIYFFSAQAHFNANFKTLCKKAFILTFGRPFAFLLLTIGSGVILYVSVNGLPFLIPFFTGSLISFLSFSVFYKLVENAQKKG